MTERIEFLHFRKKYQEHMCEAWSLFEKSWAEGKRGTGEDTGGPLKRQADEEAKPAQKAYMHCCVSLGACTQAFVCMHAVRDAPKQACKCLCVHA